MIAAPLRATLIGVAEALADALDPWWVITGAAVALHGGDTPVRDVDLLTSRRDALRLLGKDAAPGPPSDHYRWACFGQLDDWPLPVEIMVEFALRVGATWLPVRFATREMIRVGHARLPVPARAELVALLARMGRPKDLARVAMLAS